MKILKKNYTVISILLAIISVYGLACNYVASGAPLLKTNSIFTIFIGIALFVLYSFILKNIATRELICSIPVALIMAICQRLGAEFSATKHLDFYSNNMYIVIITLTVIFTALLILLFRSKELLGHKVKLRKFNKFLSKFFESKYSFWFIFSGILILWIPALLAVYPGIYSYDAGPQVWQIFGKAGLSAHHPIIHTFLLDGCFYIGKVILGDYNKGLLIYTCIQSVFMAYCFAYVINKMKKYDIPLIMQFLAFLFFAINPINQIWVMTTTKDVIFAGFFMIIVADTIDIMVEGKAYFNVKNIVSFVLKALGMCLFRNQGIYVIIFTLIFALIFIGRGNRRYALTIFLIPVIITKILCGPVSDAAGIQPANPREALSVPIQQLARTIILNGNITEEEKEIVYRYIPKQNVDMYIPVTSDTVKEGFDKDEFKKNSMDFFKVWMKVGVKNIGIYIDSFMFGSYGYFYMDESPYWIQYILYDGAWLDEGQNILGIQRHSLFPKYDEYLRGISVSLTYEKIPFVSIILNEAFPFWVMLVTIAMVLYKKMYKLLVPISLVFGFWGTLLLGPLIAIRYAYPIIICVPTMISMMFLDKER